MKRPFIPIHNTNLLSFSFLCQLSPGSLPLSSIQSALGPAPCSSLDLPPTTRPFHTHSDSMACPRVTPLILMSDWLILLNLLVWWTVTSYMLERISPDSYFVFWFSARCANSLETISAKMKPKIHFCTVTSSTSWVENMTIFFQESK